MANLCDAGWETFGVVDPPVFEELVAMVPSLVKLHTKFWEAPIIKQWPLSMIEGGHVGNPIFDMMSGMLHTVATPFLEEMPRALGPSQGWADKKQCTHAGWPIEYQSLCDTVIKLSADESTSAKQVATIAVKIWDTERPHTLCHGKQAFPVDTTRTTLKLSVYP
jgi:hypothetical protein